MQQTIEIRRGSERTILSILEETVKNCKEWMNEKSETGSLIMRETVTRLQVILTQIILICLIGAAVAVNFSFLITMFFLVCTAWATCQLNLTEKGGRS